MLVNLAIVEQIVPYDIPRRINALKRRLGAQPPDVPFSKMLSSKYSALVLPA